MGKVSPEPCAQEPRAAAGTGAGYMALLKNRGSLTLGSASCPTCSWCRRPPSVWHVLEPRLGPEEVSGTSRVTFPLPFRVAGYTLCLPQTGAQLEDWGDLPCGQDSGQIVHTNCEREERELREE